MLSPDTVEKRFALRALLLPGSAHSRRGRGPGEDKRCGERGGVCAERGGFKKWISMAQKIVGVIFLWGLESFALDWTDGFPRICSLASLVSLYKASYKTSLFTLLPRLPLFACVGHRSA